MTATINTGLQWRAPLPSQDREQFLIKFCNEKLSVFFCADEMWGKSYLARLTILLELVLLVSATVNTEEKPKHPVSSKKWEITNGLLLGHFIILLLVYSRQRLKEKRHFWFGLMEAKAEQQLALCSVVLFKWRFTTEIQLLYFERILYAENVAVGRIVASRIRTLVFAVCRIHKKVQPLSSRLSRQTQYGTRQNDTACVYPIFIASGYAQVTT